MPAVSFGSHVSPVVTNVVLPIPGIVRSPAVATSEREVSTRNECTSTVGVPSSHGGVDRGRVNGLGEEIIQASMFLILMGMRKLDGRL